MKVLIINGNPNTERYRLDSWLGDLSARLVAAGHDVSQWVVRNRELRGCTGCFACWTRTPGHCVLKDEGSDLDQAVAASDLVLLASPLIMGHMSALLRAANERFLPLLLPYVEVVEGECRHVSRYSKRPNLGLLVEPGDATAEELDIVKSTMNYTAKNFRTPFALFATTRQDAQEVVNAIDSH